MSSHQKSRVDKDEDLDDLDDVLDQFSSSAQTIPRPATSTSAGGSTSLAQPGADEDAVLTDDFAARLAEEMASVVLGTSEGPEGSAERERLAAAWEAMLIGEMDAMSDPSAAGARASSSASADVPGAGRDDFQSRIRSTMNKLKESESDLKSSGAAAGGDGDSFDKLLSQLGGLGDLSGDGEESAEELQGVLEAMMGQLMSKDVLYDPLKELHEKFPGYISEHGSTMSPEDRQRFEAQISCIRRLLDVFEARSYRDDDERAHEQIVELMGELQTHGSPPEEIMGPLPPGFSMGTDGLPNLPDDCKVN